MLARRLVGAGGEVLVAASAAAAAGDDDGLAGMGEVVDDCVGFGVVQDGADGTLRTVASPELPEQLEPRPCPPRCDLCSGLKRKWTSVLWLSEDSIRMSPPWPPSPPEGPPRGTNFSRRKAMQPLPPSPALTRILASSMNIGLYAGCTPLPPPKYAKYGLLKELGLDFSPDSGRWVRGDGSRTTPAPGALNLFLHSFYYSDSAGVSTPCFVEAARRALESARLLQRCALN